VKRFLTAYRKGMRDFHDAFVTPDGKRQDGPTAPAVLALMSRFTGVAADDIARAIPYVDPEGRIDTDSVARQIAWYKIAESVERRDQRARVDRQPLRAPKTREQVRGTNG